MRESNVIIVGCGVSGMGCATTLKARQFHDFQVITMDIGGRVCASADGRVNYGAYYVRDDYQHILQVVSRTRRIRRLELFRYRNQKLRRLCWDALRHPIVLSRLLLHLRTFDQNYQEFKVKCQHEEARKVLESHSYLRSLYRENAVEFLERNHLMPLKDCFISPMMWATALTDVATVSAANMLWVLSMLIHRCWEFRFEASSAVAKFANHLLVDEVVAVTRRQRWEVETRSHGCFLAEQLVLALPIATSRKLLKLDFEINQPIDAYHIHVRGKVRPPYQRGKFVIVAPDSDDIVVAHQADGSALVYSRRKNIDLGRYFTEWQVLGHRDWRPAYRFGYTMIDSRPEKNLFLIGDHTAVNMEDAWISGVFAANQICR